MTPSAIDAVMKNVLLSANTILATPAPTVEIKTLDAQAIEFELAFRVADFDTAAEARRAGENWRARARFRVARFSECGSLGRVWGNDQPAALNWEIRATSSLHVQIHPACGR